MQKRDGLSDAMKSLLYSALLIPFFLFPASSSAQQTIPSGTILPIQLNTTVRSDKARPGKVVTGRVMQDVPLPGRKRFRAGAKVVGHVISARAATRTNPGQIILRFDSVTSGKRRTAVTTDLRALASIMDVSEAQVPETGPDRGTPPYIWTTDQIGGQLNYHDNSVITEGGQIVGHSTPNGALVHVSATSKCRGIVAGNDALQPLWVFSSNACGLYGYGNVALSHSGRTNPVGQITLDGTKGNVELHSGSGMLLRVIQ